MAIVDTRTDNCPHCGGPLKETYSTKVGLCLKCMRHIKI